LIAEVLAANAGILTKSYYGEAGAYLKKELLACGKKVALRRAAQMA